MSTSDSPDIPWYGSNYTINVTGDTDQTVTLAGLAIELRPYDPQADSQQWNCEDNENWFTFWAQLSGQPDKWYLAVGPVDNIIIATNDATKAANFVAMKRTNGYRIFVELSPGAIEPLEVLGVGLAAAKESTNAFDFTINSAA